MTTTEQFREDVTWLRDFADNLHEPEDHPEAERLRRIANNVEMAAQAVFEPSLQLEKRAEELITTSIESAFNSGGKQNEVFPRDVLLWLIYRALKSGANKALLGQGLAGLGMGAVASLFGGLGKQPIDSEDK